MNKTAKATIVLLISTILFYCLDFFFRISPSLVVNQLMQQYHTTALGIGSLASAFYFGYTLLQIPSGVIFDRFHVKPVLVLAIVICTLFFLVFTYAHQLIFGLSARFVIGASSAFSFVGVLYIAQRYLPSQYFTLISGITIAFGTLAASGAQVVSAWMMQNMGWHYVFLILGSWGFIVAILFMLPLYRQVNQIEKTEPFNLCFAALLRQTVILLKNKLMLINGIVGSLFYMPTSVFAGLWGISFLNTTYAVPKTRASFYIMLLFAGWALGSPLIGLLGDRVKKQYRLIAWFSWLAMLVSVITIYFPSVARPLLAPLIFLFGLLSSGQVLVWKIYSNIVPAEVGGTGVAVTNMLIMLSGMVFHLLVGWLMGFSSRAVAVEMGGVHFNYQYGLLVIPLAFALAGVLAQLGLKR